MFPPYGGDAFMKNDPLVNLLILGWLDCGCKDKRTSVCKSVQSLHFGRKKCVNRTWTRHDIDQKRNNIGLLRVEMLFRRHALSVRW